MVSFIEQETDFREPKKRKELKVPPYSYERDNLKLGLMLLVLFSLHLLKTTALEEQPKTQLFTYLILLVEAKRQGTVT